jgi:hypothetical protein
MAGTRDAPSQEMSTLHSERPIAERGNFHTLVPSLAYAAAVRFNHSAGCYSTALLYCTVRVCMSIRCSIALT